MEIILIQKPRTKLDQLQQVLNALGGTLPCSSDYPLYEPEGESRDLFFPLHAVNGKYILTGTDDLFQVARHVQLLYIAKCSLLVRSPFPRFEFANTLMFKRCYNVLANAVCWNTGALHNEYYSAYRHYAIERGPYSYEAILQEYKSQIQQGTIESIAQREANYEAELKRKGGKSFGKSNGKVICGVVVTDKGFVNVGKDADEKKMLTSYFVSRKFKPGLNSEDYARVTAAISHLVNFKTCQLSPEGFRRYGKDKEVLAAIDFAHSA